MGSPAPGWKVPCFDGLMSTTQRTSSVDRRAEQKPTAFEPDPQSATRDPVCCQRSASRAHRPRDSATHRREVLGERHDAPPRPALSIPRRSGRSHCGPSLEQQVLILESAREAQHLEVGALEELTEGIPREVRAVFVVDVPEGPFAQDALRIRNLEVQHGFGLLDVGAKHPKEGSGFGDVLERVTTEDEVRGQLPMPFAVLLGQEADVIRCGTRDLALAKARIDADGTGRTTGQFDEEVTATTTDLEHAARRQAVAGLETGEQLICESAKARRVSLTILVRHAIVVHTRVVAGVLDESAARADGEQQIPDRFPTCRLRCGQQSVAMDGDPASFVERPKRRAAAGSAARRNQRAHAIGRRSTPSVPAACRARTVRIRKKRGLSKRSAVMPCVR